MEITAKDIREVIQTVGIIGTLIFAVWQWRKTHESIKVDNYSKIINAMNNLRNLRLQIPDLERAIFKTRKKWTDEKIRQRIYGVELANIFEWVFFSYKNKLISDKEWVDWLSIWQRVILAEEPLRRLMEDDTIYTFSHEAHQLTKSLITNAKKKGN